MKRLLAMLLAALMLLSLAACGEEEEKVPGSANASDGPRQDGGWLFKEENGMKVDTKTDAIDPAAVYASLTYTPEMFYGDYTITNDYKLEGKELEAYLARPTMTLPEDSIYGRDWGAEDVPTVPYHIRTGLKTLDHVINGAGNRNWARLHFYTAPDVMISVLCAFEIQGNTIRYVPLQEYNYDNEKKQVSYRLSEELVWEYEFSFSGPHLTLKSASDSITLTAAKFLDPTYFCCIDGYITPGTPKLENMHYIRMGFDYEISLSTEGRDHADKEAAVLFEDGRFVLAFETPEGKTVTRQFVYFLSGFDGITLTDGKETFYFNAPYSTGFDQNLINSVSYEELEKLEDLSQEEVDEIVEKRADLLTDLTQAFRDAGLAVTVDQQTGEINMDSAVLFDVGSATVSGEGKELLKQFMEVYTSVVFRDKYEGFLSKILVEGHTDTSGGYELNMKLSQDRADNVMAYCLSSECGVQSQYLTELEAMMQAQGHGYNNPVLDADGQVDMDASRRVAFRFVINLSK